MFGERARYFPGPDFWQAERSADAPETPQTSGIVQPPIHATAVLEIYDEGATETARSRCWRSCSRSSPRGTTTSIANGLAAARRSSRSGTRGSPGWTTRRSGTTRSPASRSNRTRFPRTRVDIAVADAAERPTDGEYDRYAYLVALYRELAYDPAAIREGTPFALRPVLFNALLVQADLDLAEIAAIVGSSSSRYRERASETARALDHALWDEERAYADFDVRAGRYVPARSAAGLAPLYAGVPNAARAKRMVERLADSRAAVGEDFAVTSQAPSDPGFQPTRYWRGPIWPILNWVLQRGRPVRLHRARAPRSARHARLADRSGLWEHYSPVTGKGHGGSEFAWTAGLVLELLGSNTEPEGGRMDGAAAATLGRQTQTKSEGRTST